MGVIQNTVEDIRKKFKERAEVKDAEKRHLASMRLEADEIERREFATHFRANAAVVARSKAFERANKESGIKRLQALSRAQNLSGEQQQPGFLNKLKEHTQRNLANTEARLAKTGKLRAEANKMRTEKLGDQRQQRTGNIARARSRPNSSFNGNRKPFGGLDRKPFGR